MDDNSFSSLAMVLHSLFKCCRAASATRTDSMPQSKAALLRWLSSSSSCRHKTKTCQLLVQHSTSFSIEMCPCQMSRGCRHGRRAPVNQDSFPSGCSDATVFATTRKTHVHRRTEHRDAYSCLCLVLPSVPCLSASSAHSAAHASPPLAMSPAFRYARLFFHFSSAPTSVTITLT